MIKYFSRILYFFFFSSRRRHTRFGCDWSSDVCSSDLLKIPVLIHVAEPSAFFDPWDYHNERWQELKEFPGRARPPARYPPFETLMTERNHLFAKHPKTNFIAAHLGFHGNDLERLGKIFDRYANVYVDIAAVLAVLGRQPY